MQPPPQPRGYNLHSAIKIKGVARIDDNFILDLFWAKDEAALVETKNKYGRGLHILAYNILQSSRDAEEMVSDTLLKAWENIPPKRPEYLGAYLSKITRNLSQGLKISSI